MATAFQQSAFQDDAFQIDTQPVIVAGGGGGGGWFAATKDEERKLLKRIEETLKDILHPQAEPLLRKIANVDPVVEVLAEVERLAVEAKEDARLQEVLAEVQAKVAIFVAMHKRRRHDEELLMVL